MKAQSTNYHKCNKKYVMNDYQNKRMLHIKDNKSCYPSHFMYEFSAFDTLEEVKAEYGDNFSWCKICFPDK